MGLDSELEKIPGPLRADKTPQFSFNKAIIEATHDLVCAFKPGSAFYEARGTQGIAELKMTCDYIREKYPEIVLISDAKRADIGSTNAYYAEYVFDYLGADAVTLHPYLGQEALRPFLDRKEKGSIILCRTSNPGAGELQDLQINGKPLYQVVAQKVAKEWNANGNCSLVVGATYPTELAIVRRIVGDMPLLVPGIGTQGGDISETMKAGLDSKHAGMVINSSRAIIFAADVRAAALAMRDSINSYR